MTSPLAAATFALGSLARRHQALSAEINALSSQLDRLTQTAAPALVARFGVWIKHRGPLHEQPERVWAARAGRRLFDFYRKVVGSNPTSGSALTADTAPMDPLEARRNRACRPRGERC